MEKELAFVTCRQTFVLMLEVVIGVSDLKEVIDDGRNEVTLDQLKACP